MYKSETNQFTEASKRLVAKYADLLEGIQDDRIKMVTAMLYENETNYLENMDEATKLVNVGSFDKYVYPLIRRTYPTLVVNDLVSVQPLTGPQGLIFYLKFMYGSSKGAVAAGTEYMGETPTSAFDSTYSSDTIKDELKLTGDGTATDFAGTLAYTPIQAGTVTISLLDTNTGIYTVVAQDDGAGVLVDTGTFLTANGTVNYATGVIAGVLAAAPAAGVNVVTTYRYNNEANTQVPEFNMDISKFSVEANTRKLRAKWSPESAQDLKNLHGLDAEVELVTILSQNIALETNREVIQDLETMGTSNIADVWNATPAAGVSYREHKDTFIDKLVDISNQIYSKTLRGEANFVVASTGVSTVIETLPGFVPASSNAIKGIGFIGTLNGRWNIFKDPFMTADKAVIGYKGDSFLDTGYVYSPYVPLMTTPTIQNADDFINRKGLMSRYATSSLNPRFYATLTKI